MEDNSYKRFVDEAIDFESNESNFKFKFHVMCKKYGRDYIEFCRAMWQANEDVMTEDEFIKMNGDMPKSFFEKVIKK